ncbi:uncharacterized protein RCH25_043514 [Pelodytes ibericus]
MDKDKRLTIERFLNHTLEIIYLLTGEEYVIVKKNSSHSTSSLLSREVPIKCGDVSVYFSMEEWDYIEEHKDAYKEVMGDGPEAVHSTTEPPKSAVRHIDNALSMGIPEVDNEELDFISINLQGEEVIDEKDIQEVEILSDTFSDNKSLTEAGWESAVENGKQAFQYRAMIGNLLEGSCQSEKMVEEVDPAPCFSGIQTGERKSTSPANEVTSCDRMDPTPACLPIGCGPTVCSFSERYLIDASYQPPQLNEDDSHYDYREESLNGDAMLADEKPYECVECGKVFTHKCSFIIHQRKHADGKVHQCKMCGKTFAYRSSLVKHHKIHTGQKDHKCSECGKLFALKYNLVQHLRTHTGEKPYECATCGRYFAYKSAFNQHQKTHTKDKCQVCADCGKCFTRKSNLVSHQSVHVRSKPHLLT